MDKSLDELVRSHNDSPNEFSLFCVGLAMVLRCLLGWVVLGLGGFSVFEDGDGVDFENVLGLLVLFCWVCDYA